MLYVHGKHVANVMLGRSITFKPLSSRASLPEFIKIIIEGLGSGWLVGFVALRPKSTAMVIAGRSVHLTTLFPGQA